MILLPVLRSLVLATGFGAVTVATYRIARMPATQPNLLGIRGLKRVRALQESPVFATWEPFLRWFGGQLGRVLGPRQRANVDARLMSAGDVLGLSAAEFVALSVLCGGATGLIAAAHAAISGQVEGRLIALAIVAAVLPWGRLASLREERRQRVNQGLPPVLDLLVLCLSAGLDLPGALGNVVTRSSNPSDPLCEELGFVLQELRVGKTRRAALTQFAERLPTKPVREFVGTVIQAEERGNPLARVLQIHAEVSRRERSVRAEEAAAKAGVRMTIPMLMMFGAILCLVVGPLVLKTKSVF